MTPIFLGVIGFCFFVALMTGLVSDWQSGGTAGWVLAGLWVTAVWLVIRHFVRKGNHRG